MSGTFVVTGNLPNDFPSMIDFLVLNAGSLPRPVVVQTLAPDLQRWAREKGWKVFDLLDKDRYLAYMNSAELLLGHCGVGFFKDCLSVGHLGYFLPRRASEGEHIDNHQLELAEFIEDRSLGHVIRAVDAMAFDMMTVVKPIELFHDFAEKLPTTGSFLAVSSIGGHYAESTRTIEALCVSGAKCLAVAVDETVPFIRDVVVIHSCRKRPGMLIALVQMIWLIGRLRPDFVVTHGAGVGFVGVLAAKLLGRPAYACESLTRITVPGRWFRGAYRIGATCFAPDTARFLGTKKYAGVHAVRVQLKNLGKDDALA